MYLLIKKRGTIFEMYMNEDRFYWDADSMAYNIIALLKYVTISVYYRLLQSYKIPVQALRYQPAG